LDIAAAANRRIWDFVHLPENLCLRPGTGYYSTPFRGGLFGEVKAEAVARQLSAHDVDVLWLGANPCMPRSLENILSPPADEGDFPSFESQIASGFFGSSRWGPTGEPQRDFNPLERPTGGWGVYRDLFDRLGRLNCVAMANFIPWGSQDMAGLITNLREANRSLLDRMLQFADDLNAEIIATLAPRLVLVPFSLARNSQLVSSGVGLSLKLALDARRHAVSLPEGSFEFYTATCRRRNLIVRTVFVRHPSSLRLSVDSKKRLVDEVAGVLGELMGLESSE
jgi:hypothetical protein